MNNWESNANYLLDDGDGTRCIHSVAGVASTLSGDAQSTLTTMLGTMRTKLCDGADFACCSSGTACEVTFCMSGYDSKKEKVVNGGEIQVADGDGGYNTLNIKKLGIATQKVTHTDSDKLVSCRVLCGVGCRMHCEQRWKQMHERIED